MDSMDDDDDDELDSNEIPYRYVIDDIQWLLDKGGRAPPMRPQPPRPRCPCPPTQTDRGGLLAGTAVRPRCPCPTKTDRARPPAVQKKTSANRLPDCKPVVRCAAAHRCGDCSRPVCGDDADRGRSTGPSFWSAVGRWAGTAARWTWAKKPYFFMAVASFALGVYADDYCQCMYESDD